MSTVSNFKHTFCRARVLESRPLFMDILITDNIILLILKFRDGLVVKTTFHPSGLLRHLFEFVLGYFGHLRSIFTTEIFTFFNCDPHIVLRHNHLVLFNFLLRLVKLKVIGFREGSKLARRRIFIQMSEHFV